jgi:Fe-S-cluster containining protein
LQPRQLGGEKFLIVEEHALAAVALKAPPRSLPVIEGDLSEVNPCSIAPCTTADHKRGSACCRDLQVEILCSRSDQQLEALVRSRLSPYLCKVSRESEDALEAEIISACGFLDGEGSNCSLHSLERPDGRPAKPDLCSAWPDDGKGLHPGCIYYTPPVKKSKKRQ